MRGDGLPDEKIQAFDFHLLDQFAFDVGVTAFDQRRCTCLAGRASRPSATNLSSTLRPDSRDSFDCMQVVLRADIEDEFAALLNYFAAEVVA